MYKSPCHNNIQHRRHNQILQTRSPTSREQSEKYIYLEFIISVTLMPDELLRPLLHDFRSIDRSNRHFDCLAYH